MMREPITAQPYHARNAQATPWPEARQRLAEADTYWLATVHPDGRPHLIPLLAVWADDRLYFCAGPATRKARNLAGEERCAISADHGRLHLVIEGRAEKVQDANRLERVAGAYAAKYGWQVDVRQGAFFADGAPSAGPPPYEVYEVIPETVFGFGTDGSFHPTRWHFTTEANTQ